MNQRTNMNEKSQFSTFLMRGYRQIYAYIVVKLTDVLRSEQLSNPINKDIGVLIIAEM